MLVVARPDRHMVKSDRSACYNELTDSGCVALPGRSMRTCNVVSVSVMSRGGLIIPDCDNRPPWRLLKNPSSRYLAKSMGLVGESLRFR